MKAYGFGLTPSGVIYTNLKAALEKRKQTLKFSLSASKPANVYFFDSLLTLSQSLKRLPDKCSVVVCDTPVLLMDQPSIEIMDFHQLHGRAWQFVTSPINYENLLRGMLKPEEGSISLENPGDFLATTALIKSQGALAHTINSVTSQLDPKKHKEFYALLAKSLLKNKALDFDLPLFEKIPKIYLSPLRNLLAEDLEALHAIYLRLCTNKSVDNLLANTQYTKADFVTIKKRA